MGAKMLVLIPAYNEQGAIRQVVGGVRRVLPQADVLVVDDGSADRTAHEARAAGAIVIRHPYNLGIGSTVQTGLKFACQQGYGRLVRLDGDGQHNPDEIPALLAALTTHNADVVVGSRFLDDGRLMPIPRMAIPRSRRIGIRFFALTVSLLTGSRVTDTTSGFFVLTRPAIRTLSAYMPHDYPEVESRIILHKAGLRTVEIPARMRPRLAGVTSINSWRSLYYAFKVSIAVLICALKEFALPAQEVLFHDPDRPTAHRHPLQPASGRRDHPADP